MLQKKADSHVGTKEKVFSAWSHPRKTRQDMTQKRKIKSPARKGKPSKVAKSQVFTALSNDCWFVICSFLPPASLLSIRAVSRAIRHATENKVFQDEYMTQWMGQPVFNTLLTLQQYMAAKNQSSTNMSYINDRLKNMLSNNFKRISWDEFALKVCPIRSWTFYTLVETIYLTDTEVIVCYEKPVMASAKLHTQFHSKMEEALHSMKRMCLGILHRPTITFHHPPQVTEFFWNGEKVMTIDGLSLPFETSADDWKDERAVTDVDHQITIKLYQPTIAKCSYPPLCWIAAIALLRELNDPQLSGHSKHMIQDIQEQIDYDSIVTEQRTMITQVVNLMSNLLIENTMACMNGQVVAYFPSNLNLELNRLLHVTMRIQ